jgi:transcriptional regulator with XRE-family HTH domain
MTNLISQQIALLLEQGGRSENLYEVAEAAGLTGQSMLNLVQGKTANPHFTTLFALCRFYDISLDYFSCPTLEDSLNYLKARRMDSDTLRQINTIAHTLTPAKRRNVMRVLRWMSLT